MFEIIVLNLIYLVFPLTLYVIYCVYSSVFHKKTNNLVLCFFLISSYYLLIRFGTFEITYLPYSLTFVPLIISYINKNEITAIIISLLILVNIFNFNFVYLFILCLILSFVIYKLVYIKLKKRNLFIVGFIFINILPIIFNIRELDIEIIIYLIENIVLTYLIVIMMDNCSKIADLYMNLKNIEREKQVRLSIFKITHEIKNPIAVCKGYLDMFDETNIEHSKKYVPIIKSEVNRTLCLLQDFLDFNKIKLQREEMDLIMLLEDVESSCLPLFHNKINFEVNIDEDDEIYLYADYNRLKQVLINVIKNSAEALKDRIEPQIKLYYKLKPDYIHIYVEDNGCGMSREELIRVKEPFFTTKSGGTGLGVTISHEVIQGHKGIIKYSSKENIGTKVEIILPLSNKK